MFRGHLLLPRLKSQILCDPGQRRSVRRPSVVRSVHRHISKTKQDRSIVSGYSPLEVGTADSVVAFRSSLCALRGDVLVSNKQMS